MTNFGQFKFESRGQDRSSIDQTGPKVFFGLVVAAMAAMNFLVSAPASADTLDDDALKSNRGSAVVLFEDLKGVLRGYGVIINPQGQVLTAAHVVSGPDGVRARLGPWQASNPLTLKVFDKNEEENVDLALIEVEKPPGNMQPDAIPRFIYGFNIPPGILRLLTGSPAIKGTLICLDANPTIRIGDPLEVRGSINSRVSGSPMFDSSGNLVGIVAQGLPGQTTAYIRSAAAIKAWLKDRKVNFDEAAPASVRIGVYFSNGYASSEANISTSRTAIRYLREAMAKPTNGSLTSELELTPDKDQKWRRIADDLFDDEALPPAERLKKVKARLTPEYLAWLRKMDFSQLYQLIVRVEWDDEASSAKLKPALLVFNQSGEKIDVEYVQDTKLKEKLFPPTDFKEATDSMSSMQGSIAVEFLHTIVRRRPDLAQNRKVLADCFRYPGLDYSKNDWMYYAAETFAHRLRDIFQKNAELQQPDVQFASDANCREALTRNLDRFAWPDHLNEYILAVSIGGSALRWRIAHPWDQEWTDNEEVPEPNGAPVSRETLGPIVEILAADIGSKWKDTLKKIKNSKK